MHEKCPDETVRVILSHLAKFHAKFWEKRDIIDQPWLMSLRRPVNYFYRTITDILDGMKDPAESSSYIVERWPWLAEGIPNMFDELAPETRKAIEKLYREPEPLLQLVEKMPMTLCHYDFDNRNLGIEDTPNGKRTVVIDWEILGKGMSSSDVVRFMVYHNPDNVEELQDYYLDQLEAELGQAFDRAVATLANAKGRVIVTGIGKSGHVGQKLAATFASTGTPAFFVHPSEASHGDLGMIHRDDAIVALSWSGESVELGNIVTYSRRFKVPLIALTSRADSALGKQSDVVLVLPRAREACPHGLAPTTSTTMQLALGDCLAIALLEHKGFTAHDFKVFHPGGSLGASLKFVVDIMHTGELLPIVAENTLMSAALVTMTQKSFGCLGVVDGKGRLAGMITDGDLRRHMGRDLLQARVQDIMTRKPNTLRPDMLASAALEEINSLKRTQMFVVEKGKPVGIVHVHDLLRAGVA